MLNVECLMLNVRMLRRRLLFSLALFAAAAHAQTVVWDKWDPMAVRTNRAADVALELQTIGAISGVRLDYANGGSITLTQTSPNRWSASVPAGEGPPRDTRAQTKPNAVR